VTAGRVLADRYELTRPLGRGGMAEVWAARDRTLGREVAVKVLLDRFREDAAFVSRFNDEARHVARLNHPNLVAVYDTGTDDGQPYIVMELVEGRSLQEAIAAGGLTEDRALEVCADVCSALEYAHARGLIHRDIKPGNILMADDGAVKVTDFGIARAVNTDTVTRTAAVLGTAAYLSPEQAQGLDLDARSDLYSLGIVLYEALTGRQPFQGDSPVTVAYQHVQEPPRPPREWEPSISPAAEAVTMRALAKNPANRYESAAQMHTDLLNARTGQPVAAPAVLTAEETALLQPAGPARQVRTHEQERRRRGAMYGVLTVLAILALLAGVWFLVGLLAGDDGPRIAVPDVVDLRLEQAERVLEQQGLEVGEVSEQPSDEIDEGRIISQRPARDTMVAEGTQVDLVVSLGREMTTVPDLVRLTEDEALSRLREEGLVAGDRSREFSSDVPEGRIISSDPEGGEEVPTGTRVAYVVSSGEETVNVRSVINTSEADAIFRLEEQGLRVNPIYEFNDVVAEGNVIEQDPTPGSQVPVGTTVTIVVSRGPEEEPPPEEEEEEEEEEEPPEEDPPPDEDEDEEEVLPLEDDEDPEEDEAAMVSGGPPSETSTQAG
jgi:eukaryotic-like serine/threonine-protein kinase